MGALVLALALVACEGVAAAATSISIAISVSVSRDAQPRLDARLTPQRVQLRPGEEVTLQLEIRNKDDHARALVLVVDVAGPSDDLAISVPANVNVPRGTTRVPVRVVAQAGIVPGRYDVDIAINTVP